MRNAIEINITTKNSKRIKKSSSFGLILPFINVKRESGIKIVVMIEDIKAIITPKILILLSSVNGFKITVNPNAIHKIDVIMFETIFWVSRMKGTKLKRK